MLFTLKHQRFPVMDVDITITPHGFHVNRIMHIYNRALLPFPLQNVPIKEMTYRFIRWFDKRIIPKNRKGITQASLCMSKTFENNEIDAYGAVKIMSLLSYGRNMTDKYWIGPVKNIAISTGKNEHGLNGEILRSHLTYKGLDFHKNGIAEDFGHLILNCDGTPREHMNFGCPDFCTNGTEKKRFIKDSCGFWLEKYVSTGMEQFKEKAKRMTLANKEHPEYFQGFQFIVDVNGTPIGYKSRCFTTKDSELVTLEDICLNDDYSDDKLTEPRILEIIENFGMEKEKMRNFIDATKPFMGESKLFQNAGLLIDVNSRNIIQMVAWL